MQKEYEPISRASIEIHQKVDRFIKKHGMTPCDWNRRYDRCQSCRWFDGEGGVCDHCGFGWPHLDHDETNHNVSLDRLAALCQYCHLNYDKEEKKRRKNEPTTNQDRGNVLNV